MEQDYQIVVGMGMGLEVEADSDTVAADVEVHWRQLSTEMHYLVLEHWEGVWLEAACCSLFAVY